MLILVAYRIIVWIADPISEIPVECENARAEFLLRNANKRTSMLVALHVLYDLVSERFCICLDQFN